MSDRARVLLAPAAVAVGALALAGCEAIGIAGDPDPAEEWPDGDIEHVVPLPAGGGTDAVTQLLNEPLEDELGVTVSTTIRDGGAGATGVNYLLDQEPDGQTLMTVPPDILTTGPIGNPDIPFDPAEDLEVLANVASDPFIMIANRESGIETFDDFVEQVEEDPDELTMGISTPMGSDHYAWLLVERELGFPGFNYVAYGGGGPQAQAVLAGEVDMVFNIEAAIDPDLLAPILVAEDFELRDFPDTPTHLDVGWDDVRASLWNGIVVHPDTPEELLEAMEERVMAAIQSDAFQQAAEDAEIIPAPMGRDEFNELVETERELAQEIVDAIDVEDVEEDEIEE